MKEQDKLEIAVSIGANACRAGPMGTCLIGDILASVMPGGTSHLAG